MKLMYHFITILYLFSISYQLTLNSLAYAIMCECHRVPGHRGREAFKSVISMNPQECLRSDKRDFETDDKATKHWNSHSLGGKKVS